MVFCLKRIVCTASLVMVGLFSLMAYAQPACREVTQKALSFEHDFHFIKSEVQKFSENIRKLEGLEKSNGTVDAVLNWVYKNGLSTAKIPPYASYRQLGLTKSSSLSELLQSEFNKSDGNGQTALRALTSAERLMLLAKEVQDLRSKLESRIGQLKAYYVDVRESSCSMGRAQINTKEQWVTGEPGLTEFSRFQLAASYAALSNLVWIEWKISEISKVYRALNNKWKILEGSFSELLENCQYDGMLAKDTLKLKQLFQMLPFTLRLSDDCDFKSLDVKTLKSYASEKYLSKLLARQLRLSDEEQTGGNGSRIGHRCKSEDRDSYGHCPSVKKAPRRPKMSEKKGGDSSGGYTD